MRGSRVIAFSLLLALPPAAPADPHRDAVLRLVAIGSAIREEARALEAKGMLGIDLHSRMAAPECAQFFQDVVSMRHVQAVRADAAGLVVRWRGKRELVLRVQRSPALEIEVHDKAGPACAVASVEARHQGGWQGKLTPMLLELPGAKGGPPQVFPVDPVRLPVREPLR